MTRANIAIARHEVAWLTLACAGTALAMSCKKKEDEVQYPPSPPQDYTKPDAGAPTTDAGGGTAAEADAAAEAGPPSVDLITQQLLDESIAARAKKEARGLKADGDLFTGVVQAGGQVESRIMIQPHKCYAVIAEGGTGIQELDIQIAAQPAPAIPLPGPILAVDTTQGPKASVSPCWKNVFPIAFPATVMVKATRGAGPIAGRVYSK